MISFNILWGKVPRTKEVLISATSQISFSHLPPCINVISACQYEEVQLSPNSLAISKFSMLKIDLAPAKLQNVKCIMPFLKTR